MGVWARQRSRRLGNEVQPAALRKLVILDAVDSLEDLRVPRYDLEIEKDRLGNTLDRIQPPAAAS